MPAPKAYSPVEGSASEQMTTEQARTLILKWVKPPTLFFDISENTGVLEISNVDLGSTSMKITVATGKTYSIPLATLTPNLGGRGTSSCGPDMDGYTQVNLNQKLQGFYFVHPTSACIGVYYGVDTPETRALISVRSGSPEISEPEGRLFADAFLVLKTAAIKVREDDDAHFAEVVTGYKAKATKPSLPEEVHRFEVQAKSALRDKDFSEAAEYYRQGLDIAPWWPVGHYNRALVLSEIDDYPGAITEMKRYLMLVPDAPNARAAQDTIYIWERKDEKHPPTDQTTSPSGK